MKFLIDKEVDLNKQDFLKTSSYSKALKEVILNVPSDISFTIGLFGEWGSGKSSIVKTVEEEFSKESKVKFVVYDAWKYSNDSFRRMFLLKLQEELKFERTEKFDSFYRNKTSDVAVRRKVDWKYILFTVAILLCGILLTNLIPKEQVEIKITLALVVTFLGILVNVLGRAFSDYKVTVQEPMIFAPEQFEECFNEMTPKVFESNNAIAKFSKWVKGEKYISGLDKLVLVIDNIDRCPKDKAYEMITNIKSFLSTQKKVIFLIPVDDEALKRHIIKEENNDTKEAEEFLRKFFSVTIRIKPFKRFDLYDFTNNINKDYKLNFNPTTIDIVSKEYATNPRRIIQFFNDLTSELKIFELKQGEEFARSHESLICKMLILRQEWPEYYKKISKNSSLINDPDGLQEYLKGNEDLSSFLNVTESITRNESYTVIETVLSTFDRESKLSTEIISLIDKKQIPEIEKAVSENKVDKNNLIDYLIERLNTGIKRKTFKTDVNNVFEIICSLDIKLNLDRNQNDRVATEVSPRLRDFFNFISNLDVLVTYGHRLRALGLNYLDDFLVRYLRIGIADKNDDTAYVFTKSLFRAYIQNESSRDKLESLAPLFDEEFHKSGSRLIEYNLDSDQLNDIVNDNVLSTIIGRLDAIDLENENFKELVHASSNITLSNTSFKEAVTKISELIPALTNYSKDQIVRLIECINEIIVHQHNVASSQDEKDSILNLKSKLLSNRVVSGRSVNILTEVLENLELRFVTHFLKNIYVCSNGSVDVLTELNSTLSYSPTERQEEINLRLIELKNEYKYTLIPLINIILNDTTYSDSTFELLQYTFTLKDAKAGTYRVNDSQVSQKLEAVTNHFKATKSQNAHIFLEKIISDDRAKNLLNPIIINMTKDDILDLPQKIQELSFEKILDGDTIFEYEDNIDFLKAVASKGERKHISRVIKVVVSKLQRQDKVHEGIDILNEIRELKGGDRKAIEGVIESMEDGENKEKAESIIKRLK